MASSTICTKDILGADLETMFCYVVLNDTDISCTKIITDSLDFDDLSREAMSEVMVRSVAEEKWLNITLIEVRVFARRNFSDSSLSISKVRVSAHPRSAGAY